MLDRDRAEARATRCRRRDRLQPHQPQAERRRADEQRRRPAGALVRDIRRAAGPRARLGVPVVDRDGEVPILRQGITRALGGVEEDPIGAVGPGARRHGARDRRLAGKAAGQPDDIGGHPGKNGADVLLDARGRGGVAGPEPDHLERRAGEHDQRGDGAAAGKHPRDADPPFTRQRRFDRRLDH